MIHELQGSHATKRGSSTPRVNCCRYQEYHRRRNCVLSLIKCFPTLSDHKGRESTNKATTTAIILMRCEILQEVTSTLSKLNEGTIITYVTIY